MSAYDPYDHDGDFKAIWERREDENSLQYERFLAYLNLGEARTINKVVAQYGLKNEGNLHRLSAAREWTKRVAAYDRYVQGEIEKKTRTTAIRSINADMRRNNVWIEQHEKMQQQLWDMRNELLRIGTEMVSKFEVGTKKKSGSKTYFTWEEVTHPSGKKERVRVKNIVQQESSDPRWAWRDTVAVIDMVNQLGQQVLNLPPDAIKLLPEFMYQLRRNGHNPIEFMQKTIDALKAS